MDQGNKLHCSIFNSLNLFFFFFPRWAGQLLIWSTWPDGDVRRFKIFPTLFPASATEWTVGKGPFPSSTGMVKNRKRSHPNFLPLPTLADSYARDVCGAFWRTLPPQIIESGMQINPCSIQLLAQCPLKHFPVLSKATFQLFLFPKK